MKAIDSIIKAYQIFISTILKNIFGVTSQCRYSPTCSEYARAQFAKKGLVRGGILSARRILSCNPFISI